jgi:hypothetical protein
MQGKKNPVYPGESTSNPSGWIRGLACALHEKLGNDRDKLFKKQEIDPNKSANGIISDIGVKLDVLAAVLDLIPI